MARNSICVGWQNERVNNKSIGPKKRFVNSRSAATPTRSGASNLDAIINEGTLTIGWAGPALVGILIAAFDWAGRVFEWLGTLTTWLFSGEWRSGGEV